MNMKTSQASPMNMNAPNITGSLVLKVIMNGKPYSVAANLPEAAQQAYGPMALEGGCLMALREACLSIWEQVRREE
jgi:hypothetical protein